MSYSLLPWILLQRYDKVSLPLLLTCQCYIMKFYLKLDNKQMDESDLTRMELHNVDSVYLLPQLGRPHVAWVLDTPVALNIVLVRGYRFLVVTLAEPESQMR